MKSNVNFLSEKRSKHKFISLIAITVLLSTLLVMTVFNSFNLVNKNAKTNIKEKAHLNNNIISERFDKVFDILYSASSMISLEEDIKSPEVLQKLKQITSRNGFTRMAITTPDGTSYTDDGKIHNSSNRSYFTESMKGKKFVTEIEKSVIDGKPFIAFSCPVIKNLQVVGVLRATISTDYFLYLVDIEEQTGSKDVFLIDPNGSVILINENNIFNKMLKQNKKNNTSVNALEQATINQKEISIKYLDGKTKMVAYSVPFKYNDWCVITILSKAQANENYHVIYIQSFIVAVLFIIMIIINLIYLRGILKQFKAEKKILQKEINIISSSSSQSIFWYDINKKTLRFSEGFQEQIGCRPCVENAPENILEYDYIFSEHIELFKNFMERITSGLRYNEAYLKFKKADGKFSLFKVSSTTIYLNSLPYKVIGYIEKATSKSKLNDSDIEVYDTLTGLYNKLSIKNQINDFVKDYNDSVSALLIIDIFNFRNINEKLGYSTGDAVIKDVANKLKSLFRSSDILARTGDDEFAVFMKNINSIELLTEKIKTIISSANKVISEDKSMSVTVNIGVAMFPQDGDDFNELFKNATTALFKAKRKGGGFFDFFTN